MGIGNGMGKVNGIGYGIDNLYESNRHFNGQSRSVWQEIFHLFPFPSSLLLFSVAWSPCLPWRHSGGCRCEMSTVFLSAKLANQKPVGGNVNRCSLHSFPSLQSLQLQSQATCTLPDIRLETLFIDFVLQIRLEIRFPLLVDVSEPDVQIGRHILSSQCQCLTC